jgi:hypothetical protein
MWLPRRHGSVIEESRVSLVRRFVAFQIDVAVAGVGVIPFVIPPVLVSEYLATGVWQWSFERKYFRPTDWVLFAA